MKLNRMEFFLMNSPVRGLIQERIEFPRLRKHFTLDLNKKILEIGCGSGWGAKLINSSYTPSEYVGIDLDERMISIARQKNPDPNMSFVVGNAAALPFQDGSFDAVFDFGIIHHIADWKSCIKEVFRVLKEGGLFVIEDLSLESFRGSLQGRLWKRLTDHPYDAMYQNQEFMDHLNAAGFSLRYSARHNFLGSLKYFTAIAAK
jgi:ubiquinone/menaquinone biosynthesis C-methylase UbiE